MRWLALIAAGCVGSVPAQVPPETFAASKPIDMGARIDPFAALAATGGEVSYLMPGRARLDDGGVTFDAMKAPVPVTVRVVEQHGSAVRAAVQLEQLRFLVWSDRDHLLAMLRHDQRVSSLAGAEFVDLSTGEPMQAVLRQGASVQRLAHKDHWTQIRYLGALEIDGWVPDEALADRGTPSDRMGRIPTGRQMLTLLHGAVIRNEPKWAGRQLAVMANGYFVDSIQKLDDAWHEVGYADGDIIVHGYVSTHDPPGQVHRPKAPDAPPPPIQPNATAAIGTCLYAHADGDPIGYIVQAHPIEITEAPRPGWWTILDETPWGPTTFVVKGSDKTELAACAPASVMPAPPPSVP
jgi:hypothetical protein